MSISSSTNRNAQKFRIVTLGDQSVGKTSIIQKYMHDTFSSNNKSTIGVDFSAKQIQREGVHYRLQLWDTAGQERYRSLIPSYIRNSHCAIFVFDVSLAKSFESVRYWHKIFRENAEAPGFLVANKIDLTRKIDKEQALKLAKQLDLTYIQVSAKSGKKINQLFQEVLDKAIQFKISEAGNFSTQPLNTQKNINVVEEKKTIIRKQKNNNWWEWLTKCW